MASVSQKKVLVALGVILSLSWTGSADNETQNRSKFKYGYVISHSGGGTQAHLESRDGNLALGRYYVNLQNGTGQKVTYFADDLGFHTGVSYSSQSGKGSSNTQIAVGQRAVAALVNPNAGENTAAIAFTPTLLFGKKILKTAFNTATPQSGIFPLLNYTPVPGGFFLTHKPVETSNDTTERPAHVSPSHEDKYSEGVSQSKTNTQTFYETPENVKNVIKELHIESTTPSIKSYTLVPQQELFSSLPNDGGRLSQEDHTVRVSSYATGLNDLSYSKEKSIEMTNFAGIDAQLISEVQKHAEGIIMKDLQRSQNAKEGARYPSTAYQPSTVTLQPIVVTNDGETGINTVLPTTPLPEARKLSKNLHSDSINAVKTTGKNSDQTLEDSGYFRVSLSPSLSSSINVSQTPHQSINVQSTDRNSDSNNSTLCEFNLCEKNNEQIFSVDLSEVSPKKETEDSGTSVSDPSNSLGTEKIVRTFYPENKAHAERHYITTIDVQKAISLNVNQNEAGSIHFAQNFPFDKIKPFSQIQNQPTPPPLIPAQVSVTPEPLAPEPNLNHLGTPQKQYDSNPVTAAPGLFDVVPNQNPAVLQGLNDLTSSQYNPTFQERVGNNRFEYENQLVVPPPPVDLTNQPNDVPNQQQEDLKQIQESIQALRQQVIENIDAQHEEEQRKQNLIDQERRQYFQNLQKVEILKNQNSLSYQFPVQQQPDIAADSAQPVNSAESVSNVELVPQSQYIPPPPPQHNTYNSPVQSQVDQTLQTVFESPPQTFKTEIKDFKHEVVVPQPNIQPIDVYQKSSLSYDSREIQTSHTPRQYVVYDTRNVYAADNNLQQSTPEYVTEKMQLNSYAQVAPIAAVASVAPIAPMAPVTPVTPVAFQPRYGAPQVTKAPEKPSQKAIVNGQLIDFTTKVLAQTSTVPAGKPLLVNNVVPFDYNRFLGQSLSLLQSYAVPLPAESKIVPGIYPVPEQVALPIQIPQAYKLTYPAVADLGVASKPYHSYLTHRPTNKLRVQPLKPSVPDDSGQREAVQNLLSQPQFHRTFYYSGFPINNRLQLRHVQKGQISNSDQVRSQSIRRGKSLKNLRIEYGFKPPLRPSVEFSEEVKPSIYGPSVQPQ